MGWNKVTKFEAIPDIMQKLIVWLYYALLVEVLSWAGKMPWNMVMTLAPDAPRMARRFYPWAHRCPSHFCQHQRPWQHPLLEEEAMDHSMNHREMARNGKKWQLCWCWTMIDMMNAHCHDGCDLVRCPEGLMYDNLRILNILSFVRLIWFSQSLCDFDMQHVLSDSWFGRPCLPHLLQSKQSATASCSRQGVPRFKQSCLLDHPLHSWDSWFQWKHIFWKELKLQTKRASKVYKPTWPIINQYTSI